LSNGYLRSLIQYLSSVYDIGSKIKKLRDNRTSPKITTSSIAFTLLIGFMLKIRSFNQLDDWLEHNDFRRIVPRKMKLPRIDAIRDSLKVIEIADIVELHHSTIPLIPVHHIFPHKSTAPAIKNPPKPKSRRIKAQL